MIVANFGCAKLDPPYLYGVLIIYIIIILVVGFLFIRDVIRDYKKQKQWIAENHARWSRIHLTNINEAFGHYNNKKEK